MRKKGLWKKSASVLIAAAMLMTSVPVYAAEPDEQVEEVVVQEQTEDAEKEVEEIRLEDESAGAENDGEEKVVVEETTEEDNEELCVGAGAVEVYVNGQYQNNQTLENAINNANSDSTIDIQLLENVEVNDTIWINTGKKVTLDLNGYDVVFKGESINGENRLFVQYGTLDVTGSGTLREETASYAPIIVRGNTNNSPNWTTVNIGENVTLEGWSGIFVSAPNGNCADGVVVNIKGNIQGRADATGDPGCGVYVNGAINHIDGNIPHITLDSTSSITSPGDGIYAAGHAKWTLKGNITASTALSIKSGIFDISSGTYHSTGAFVDTPVTENSGPEDTGAALNITSNNGYAQKTYVKITGGSFISDNGYAVYEGIAKSGNTPAAGASYATLSIKGGFFKGNNVRGTVSLNEMAKKAVISGGYFNVPFTSDYIVKDERRLELLVNQDSYQDEYGYVVGVRKPTEVEPAVGEPEVDLKGSSISEKKQEDVKKAAENVEATGLGSCANEVASDVTQNEANEAKIQGTKELDRAQIPHTGDNITIYAQTYLDIKPKEFTDTITDGKTPIYSLDIEPKYYLVASTAKTSEDIRLKDEGDKKKNAAKIPNTGGSVDTTNRVVKLDIPLPDGFIREPAPKTLFVKHVKKNGKTYYYYADVKATTVNGKTTYSVSFTNDKGFSTFTILAAGTVAEVGGVGYTSLDAALKAATSDDTVYLLKDVTVKGTVIDSNKNITLNLNGNTINGKVENKGTVTITGNGKIIGNISSSGTTSIQSGTFAGTLTTNGNGKFSISGGTFKPGTVKPEYCASGYEPNADRSGVSAIYYPVQPSSSNNNLSALTLSKGILTPAFDKNTTSYTAVVDENVDSITVTPVTEDSLASIQVNGKTVASGKASEAIALQEGENIITVVVTAQNGEQKTYTIKVTRNKAELGSNADLAGLTLSKGTLSPKFSAEKEQYKAVVENAVSSILVTPKAADENSTVTVNGKPASEKVDLQVGYNTIKVKVVSADGKATKTYTIQVTRVVPKNKTITISRRKYKVTNELIAKASVAITGLSDNKVINLSVPDTIQIYGVTYKVTSIEKNAFRGQPQMKTAKIGNNVTAIGYGAFYACPILNSVTVGKSVKTIGNHAFCRDTKLRTLTFQGTALTKIENHVLYQVTNLAIKAPSSKVKAYKKLFTNKGTNSFKVVKK